MEVSVCFEINTITQKGQDSKAAGGVGSGTHVSCVAFVSARVRF